MIPDYSSFCCLALNGPRLQVDGHYTVIPGVTISSEQSDLTLEPHWVEWLGSIQTDAFKKSTLYIMAHLNSLRERVDRPAVEFLDMRVRMLHHALLLLGCGYNKGVLMVGGNTYSSSDLHIGPIRSGLTPCRRPYFRESRKIDPEDIIVAGKILTNLELIYSHVPDRLYRRLRKGFNVWVRAVEEGQEWTERFHNLVRSLEALLKPTIARPRSKSALKKSKRHHRPWRNVTYTFAERGQAFIGHSTKSKRMLRQFYEIRSSIEHIKDIMPTVRRAKDVDHKETFEFRTLQSEILASSVYARILSSDALMNAFSTESRVEGFWAQSGRRRQALWGDIINLDQQARDQFISHVTPDFYY